jgi:hypothetical protein
MNVARPAGAVDLRIVSAEVRRQFMLFDQRRKIGRIQQEHQQSKN